MDYRVEYYGTDESTGKMAEQPQEVHLFQRSRLSRRDINNMLLVCNQPGREICGFVYRNRHYIGMVSVTMNDLYKNTTIILGGKKFFKFQWRNIYRDEVE